MQVSLSQPPAGWVILQGEPWKYWMTRNGPLPQVTSFAWRYCPSRSTTGRHVEAAFYEAFFQAVTHWADVDATVRQAYEEAGAHGLAAMDALHIAAASLVGADELVTTEKPGRLIHRTRSVPVRTLYPTDQAWLP